VSFFAFQNILPPSRIAERTSLVPRFWEKNGEMFRVPAAEANDPSFFPGVPSAPPVRAFSPSAPRRSKTENATFLIEFDCLLFRFLAGFFPPARFFLLSMVSTSFPQATARAFRMSRPSFFSPDPPSSRRKNIGDFSHLFATGGRRRALE